VGVERYCPECGAALAETAHPNARFCGVACRNRWNNSLAKTREIGSSEHGRRIGYARGCRCEDCLAFNASESRRHRAAQPKKPPAPPRQRKGIKLGRRNPDEHGTSAYAYGCRCQDCKTARSRQNAEWARRNPDKFRANQRRYRKRNPREPLRVVAPYDGDAIAYADILALDPCVYCGLSADTIDHIDPVSISRSSRWDNLAPACRSCNSSKGTKDLLGFLLYRRATADMEVARPA
jgi:5-methylcytosine-specific restriction endonuclease McrA